MQAHLSHEPEMISPDEDTFKAQTFSVCPTSEYLGSSDGESSGYTLITVSVPPVAIYPARHKQASHSANVSEDE